MEYTILVVNSILINSYGMFSLIFAELLHPQPNYNFGSHRKLTDILVFKLYEGVLITNVGTLLIHQCSEQIFDR